MEFEGMYRQPQRPKYDCLLFDLDDTLYPVSSGLAASCGKNIRDYMVEKLGIDKGKIDTLCNLLYKNYGTTMAGLRAIGYDFDYDDYHRLEKSLVYHHLDTSHCLDLLCIYVILLRIFLHPFNSFVHGRLPYENLKPDPVLRSLLLSLPYRKIIFTNADKIHAVKALSRLGLEECFEGIICFETLNPVHKNAASDDEDDIEFVGLPNTTRSSDSRSQIFNIVGHFSRHGAGSGLPKTPVVCKPSEDAIERALSVANINPQRTIFFEDSVRNIQAGKRVGLQTVLVGTSNRPKGADHALENIHNLREAIPELWEFEVKSEVGYPGKVAVETSVTA